MIPPNLLPPPFQGLSRLAIFTPLLLQHCCQLAELLEIIHIATLYLQKNSVCCSATIMYTKLPSPLLSIYKLHS